MHIETLVVGPIETNCYIVSDPETKEAVIIDAGDEAPYILNYIEQNELKVTLLLNTHGHYDHTGGFVPFCALNEKAPIYLHKNGFRDSYGFRNGAPEDEKSGILWTEEEIASMKDRLILTDGPVYVTENICIMLPRP